MTPTTPRGTRYTSTRLPASTDDGISPSIRVASADAISKIDDQFLDLVVGLGPVRLALVEGREGPGQVVPPLPHDLRHPPHGGRALERGARRPVHPRGVRSGDSPLRVLAPALGDPGDELARGWTGGLERGAGGRVNPLPADQHLQIVGHPGLLTASRSRRRVSRSPRTSRRRARGGSPRSEGRRRRSSPASGPRRSRTPATGAWGSRRPR